MPFNANTFTGLLREVYGLPITELIRNENADTFFGIDRFNQRITGDFRPTPLLLETIEEAMQIGLRNMTGRLEHDLYNDSKDIQELSLLTVPKYPTTEDPIMFDQEWV